MSDQAEQVNGPYVILAIPLLLESKWFDLVDRILVIDTSVEQQILHSKARDSVSEAQIRSIIENQVDREARCKAADDIIHNDSDLARLKEQVLQLHQQYIEMADKQPTSKE